MAIKHKMDVKTKANSTDYLKSLVFSKKEIGILKLIEFLPFINTSSHNPQLKIVYMKIMPVFFSYAELNKCYIQECLTLIAKIKRHPFFIHEKSMFDGWQLRLRTLLPNHIELPISKETKLNENRFINIPGTDRNDVIGYADLDLFFRFHKWLKYHKLHKYLYFFANLSYTEIENINSDNIQSLEDKINLHPMTTGARNAILRKLSELHQRSSRLEIFCKSEYFTSMAKIEKSISEIKTILKTPIRRNRVFCENNLPDLLNKAMETVICVILRLSKEDLMKMYEPAITLLKMAWGCSFFENEVKNKINVLQSALNSKLRSHSKRKLLVSKDMQLHDNHLFINQPVHFDIESGIRAITWYLENVLLQEF